MRGFELSYDWILSCNSNGLPCFGDMDQSLGKVVVTSDSNPHPPLPETGRGGENTFHYWVQRLAAVPQPNLLGPHTARNPPLLKCGNHALFSTPLD